MPKPVDFDETPEPAERGPMRPLVSYYGGKQRMASKIVDLLPRHTVYVEPFAGGAAVLFKKPWPPATNTHHYREVINDIDGRLINLYRVIQDETLFGEFYRQVSAPHSRMIYAEAKECNKRCKDKTIVSPNVDAAVAYYINIQQSFGNILCGGWGTSVFGFNLAVTWANKIQQLPQYLDRMLLVHVEHDDALSVIKRWDSPQTLFYCDPPYPSTCQGHYEGYTQEDFQALVYALDSAQGSFVLSSYGQSEVPDSWERFEFQARCSASGEGKTGNQKDRTQKQTSDKLGDCKRTEVLWRMDRSAMARRECQEIWNKWGWQEGVGMGQVKWAKPKARKRRNA